jgi:hypothetical protein
MDFTSPKNNKILLMQRKNCPERISDRAQEFDREETLITIFGEKHANSICRLKH